MSQACAATRRTSPIETPHRSATIRYGSGAGLSARAALRGREVDVRARQAARERDLEHQREPLRPERRVAERGRERRVQRTQIEEGLVDVEGEHGHFGGEGEIRTRESFDY